MTTEASLPELDDLLEPLEPPTETAALRNASRPKRFSSLRPNNDLIWALIDDSEFGKEEHDEAVAIMSYWQTGSLENDPVWRANAETRRVRANISSDGTTGQPVACKLRPVQPEVPQVSTNITALYKEMRPESVTTHALNQQYQAWVSSPELEAANFHVTLSVFVRSEWRVVQCRNLLSNSPETWMEPDDIFADFVLELLRRMGKGQYTHADNLDGWIAYIWDNYFFPEKQEEVFEYLNSTSFVNNVEPSDRLYKHQKHCVNTANIIEDGDELNASSKSIQRVLRELDDPQTVFGKMNPDTKAMIRNIVSGRSRKQIASEMGVTERTVRNRIYQFTSHLNDGRVLEEVWK